MLLLAPPDVSQLESELKRAPVSAVPQRFRIYDALAQALAEKKENSAAEDAFRNALDLNRRLPQFDSSSALRYAEFLAGQNRLSDCGRLLNEILRREPEFAPALLQQARLLVVQNRRDDGIELAEEALKMAEKAGLSFPQDRLAAIHLFLSVNYFAAGREDLSRVHQLWIQQQR
jgi:tetratricopeptide (TPR) repeat protein